jgi:hypothetical protein
MPYLCEQVPLLWGQEHPDIIVTLVGRGKSYFKAGWPAHGSQLLGQC